MRHYISEIEGKILAAKEFSRLLNVSPTLIGSIERGVIPPSKKVASKLEERYGISREWFLTGEGLAPWEEKEYEEALSQKEIAPAYARFAAVSRIRESGEHKILDHLVEAAENSLFRRYIYNVLEGGIVSAFRELMGELQAAWGKTKQLEAQLAKRPAPYAKNKFPPREIRQVANGGKKMYYESTEISFTVPGPLPGLQGEDLARYENNTQALERWREAGCENWPSHLPPPAWVLQKFCGQASGFYSGGSLADIGGLLWDFIEEGK